MNMIRIAAPHQLRRTTMTMIVPVIIAPRPHQTGVDGRHPAVPSQAATQPAAATGSNRRPGNPALGAPVAGAPVPGSPVGGVRVAPPFARPPAITPSPAAA